MYKKHLLALLMLTVAGFSKAQNTVTIPDANFVTALTTFFPGCMTGNQLDTTCATVVGAQGLSLFGKNIINFEGIQYFDNLTNLDISNNPATTLTVLPRQLQELTAENIPLTALPTLPSTLTRLEMNLNFLTTLPALPSGMTILRVETNDLVSLPTLPPGLISLQVQNNNLTSVPSLPAPLNVLNVANNQITAIPTLPSNLGNLDISSNFITTLPTLPNSLIYLDISNNSISSLPASLPPNLTQFLCGSNQISTLPSSLPTSLWNFACGYNTISSIPPLPAAIRNFYCQDNQLTSIPTLPAGLQFLFCQNNQITSLPALPTTLINVSCGNNQISCFPTLPPNSILTLFPNPATCLPNYTAPMTTTLLAYPLCVAGNTSSNPNGCLDATGIYGMVFDDTNASCLFDQGESPRNNLPVELRDGGGSLVQRGFVTGNGAYYLNAGQGSFAVTVDTTGLPWIQASCAGGFTRNVSLSQAAPTVSGVDIETECGTIDEFGIQAVTHGIAFPGTQHPVSVTGGDLSRWFGFNCGSGAAGQIEVSITGPVTYAGLVAGSQTPSINGLTFTYTVSDFGTWDFEHGIGILLNTDTTAQMGASVCVSAQLTTSAQDANPNNNSMNFCYPVLNSYDPNMKESHPPLETDAQGYITYTIHFQNNGTAPARLVKLLDTLDTALDWSTFEPTAYSHFCETYLNGGILSVRYPNINLIDSATNYAASQGFYQYRIKPFPTLEPYKLIQNKADIFFDFNAPITTNTTTNYLNFEISRPEGLDGRLSIFPNPSCGKFEVKQAGGQPLELRVFNSFGQMVWTGRVAGSSTVVDLERMPAGMYWVEATDPQGKSYRARWVKQ
jgi:uncharacterized repeat protein (TIGR01451 family)